MEDDAPMDNRDPAGEPDSAPGPLVPSLTSFVLMAAGATLMVAAVFGTELVRGTNVRFSWARLGIAGFGLLALLAGLAWFLVPPGAKNGD
jgi:hypothetical protein